MSARMEASSQERWHLLLWPFRHIRWKIVLPYAFLTVLLAVTGSYLATELVTGSLEERFDNQRAEAGRGVSDKVVRKEREHLETVRAVAFTDGVAAAVQADDKVAVNALVQPIAANAGVERVEVLDVQGNRLTAMQLTDARSLTYEQLSDADTPGEWPLVRRVIEGESDQQGDKYAQIIETSEGFVLYTAGPVYSDTGTAGVVLVGTTLESFVAHSKAEALADVTVYDFTGNPLASTFAVDEAASPEEANLDVPAPTLDDSIEGVAVREQRSLFSRNYDLLYGRLELRGQVVGLYSVGLPTAFIFNP